MAIENVGPGGVGNNYGVRETVARERYELDKEYIEEYTDADGKVVTSKVDPVTGGIGIIGPDGKQVAGTASPYAFTTRALAENDNGQTRVCASAQTATVNASMPVGFGVAFKGAISFTAGSGVTIADVRTTGAANPWCALTQTGVDTYDVVGTKA